MPVKPSPTGGWDISVSVGGKRVHRRLPAGTPKSVANQLDADLRSALGRRLAAIPGDPALTEVMAGYMEHAKGLRSPETAEYHALRLGQWCIGFRASQARQVAAQAIVDLRARGYAPATINKSLGALKAGLRLAFEQGRTVVNYSDHVRRLPENNMRDRVLTMEEVRSIADHASEATSAAIWIAIYTGCRRGEILKLQPEDIGKDALTLRAGNTKTLKTRVVPIVSPLRPWLAHVPLAVNFEGLKSGFRRAREAAGMPDVTFHDLRRSCATILLQAGVDLHVVSKLLGHSSVTVTAQRYAHLQVAQVAEGLRRAFEPAPSTGSKKKPAGTVVLLEGRLTVVRDEKAIRKHRLHLLKLGRRHGCRERNARRRCAELERLAPWADRSAIRAIYREAARLSQLHSVLYEVDHDIPLRGKHVSGLHVETNLRIVPRKANRQKSNRFDVVGGEGFEPPTCSV